MTGCVGPASAASVCGVTLGVVVGSGGGGGGFMWQSGGKHSPPPLFVFLHPVDKKREAAERVTMNGARRRLRMRRA